MPTVHQTPSFVHPFNATIAIVGLPEVLPDVEPFLSPEDVGYTPSPMEEAWKIAFDAAFAGEPADYPTPAPHLAIREASEARAIGKTLAVISDICCPPAGYAAHEAEAYREGFAEGQRAFEAAVAFEAEDEDDAQTEAWIKHMEAERLGDALAVEMTDADVWPLGCVS
jgi:hypothetical protein